MKKYTVLMPAISGDFLTSFDEFYRGFEIRIFKVHLNWIGHASKVGRVFSVVRMNDPLQLIQSLRGNIDNYIAMEFSVTRNISTERLTEAIDTSLVSLQTGILSILKCLASSERVVTFDDLLDKTESNSTINVTLSLAHYGRLVCDLMMYTPIMSESGRDPYLSMLVEVDSRSDESFNFCRMPKTLVLTYRFYKALKKSQILSN